MNKTVTLYGRRGCHLCDQMLDELTPLAENWQLSIDYVDVDTVPALANRYGDRVPVLEADGRVLCEARLDTDVFGEFCRAQNAT